MLGFADKPSPATERAIQDIDRAYERCVELLRIEQQARHAEFIRHYTINPSGLLTHLSAPLRTYDPFLSFASTSEAVEWLSREIDRQRQKAKSNHWSYDPWRLEACLERLPIAQYFAEHGRRLWARPAA